MPGDLSPSRGTGAYCRSLSSQYNHTPRPPVVAVREGAHGCSCGARPIDDLLALDVADAGEHHSDGDGPAPMAPEPGARPLRVALLGCGVVGSAVATGCSPSTPTTSPPASARPLELVGIAVRRPQRPRPDVPVDPALFTTDAEELVTRADVVIEVIGGIEPARGLILRAMEHGASVVTANKALLAEDGPTLTPRPTSTASTSTTRPPSPGPSRILRPIRESLAGDEVRRVLGIVNGTTNYVLDKMDTTGAGFAEAVEQAQALGYAEADPTADVEGFDAAAKAAILASLAFHTRVSLADVLPRGHHRGDRRRRRRRPREMDCVVKLLAICERTGDDGATASACASTRR